MFSLSKGLLRLRVTKAAFWRDGKGVAAIEFAMIVPLMLVMFFGTVEVSSGVAAKRKTSLAARTLSDLVSQETDVSDTLVSNVAYVAGKVYTPYPAQPLSSTITELYVDPTTLKTKVVWSNAYTYDASGNAVVAVSSHKLKDIVTLPSADLAVAGTYLIWSEVSYKYVPTVGYVMAKAGITLTDQTFTRPRQSSCVTYNMVCALP